MQLKLTIAEKRSDIMSILSEVFQEIPKVTIQNVDLITLRTQPEIDALLMLGMFAHERYGGMPEIGQSQIMSTGGEQGTPPWVVTTPPFAGRLEKQYQPDGTVEDKIVEVKKLSVEDKAYIVFDKVFKKVEGFNQQKSEVKIKTLGFELEFLNFPLGEPYKEIEAMQRAYIEHCQRTQRNWF